MNIQMGKGGQSGNEYYREKRYSDLMWLAVDAQRMGYRKAARMLVRIAGKYYANRSK